MNSGKSSPSNKKSWRHTWTPRFYAAALLIALGLLLFWMRDRQDKAADSTAGTRQRTSYSAHQTTEAELRRTASSRSSHRTLPEGILTTHEPEQLKDFYLIQCSGHNVSIHTALKLLDEAYREACYYSLEKPLKIKYIVDGESDKLISFSIKGKKWSSALKYIAALAGMEVKHEGLEVHLVPLKLEERARSGVQISEALSETLLQELIDRGEWDAHAEKPDYMTLLRLHGVLGKAEITNAIFNYIIIDGTNLDTAAIAALLRMEAEQTPLLSNHSKIFISPTALAIPQGALTQEAAQKWLRDLSQQDGIQMLTAPTVFSPSGKTATVEIKEERGNAWTGMQFNYLTQPIGLKLSAESTTEIRPADQSRQNQRSEDRFVMYEGDTQIKAIGHDAGGYYYQITSLKNVPQPEPANPSTIDQILNNPNRMAEKPIANSVPGKPGFVFSPYTNQLVDVRDIPQGVLVADPNFPAEEKKFFRVP